MLIANKKCLRRHLVRILVPGVILCVGTAARADDQKRRGFLLQIADEKGLLSRPPEVTIRGNLGTTRKTMPKDDGKSPDVKADDRLYVQPVPTFLDPKVIIEVRSGDKLWKAQAEFKPNDVRARVIVILEPNGKTQTNIHSDNAPPPNATGPRPPPGKQIRKKDAVFISQDETSFSSKLGTGFVLWVIAFVLFAAALALIRFSRKGDGDEEDEEDDDDEFDDVEDDVEEGTDSEPKPQSPKKEPE